MVDRELSRSKGTSGSAFSLIEREAELRLLGHDLAESTVAKYMVRRRKPPSSTWKSFLKNHAREIAACDFFVVPTATFRLLYCFVILSHDRRRVIHFNVTSHPTAQWAAQ